MKTKYNGLVCLFIFAFAGIFLVIYGVLLSDKIAGSIRISRPPSVSDIKIPDNEVMSYIDFLTSQLSALVKSQNPFKKTSLRLFGFSGDLPTVDDTKNSSSLQAASENTQISRLSYILTLSFTSPKKNFCMIDSKLYTENQNLPDDGKILKIETGRVLILKDKKKQWLYPEPQ